MSLKALFCRILSGHLRQGFLYLYLRKTDILITFLVIYRYFIIHFGVLLHYCNCYGVSLQSI